MSQFRVQESAGIAVLKKAMESGRETATNMTEIMKEIVVDPNLGNNIDVSV